MREPYRHFTQVDVFTTRPLAGNALAVFESGAGLSTARMQAIAREMNLSETTFLLDPAVRNADARVRIFTPFEELPFAGHPTLGTAYVVAKRRRLQEVRLQMKAGVIPVQVDRRKAGVYLEMGQNDPVFGATVAPDRLARAIGLTPSDLDARVPPQVVSTGLPFLIVPLRTTAALQRLAPDYHELMPMLREEAGVFLPYYLVTGESNLEARMFGPNFDDPGTGSAAGCAATYLVRYGLRPPGRTLEISQGRLLKRPCRIYARAGRDGAGRDGDVRVGGYVVESLQGSLLVNV